MLSSGLVAAYIASAVAITTACLRMAQIGPWRTIADVTNWLGVPGVIACFAALHAVIALAVVYWGWGGFDRTTRRLVGARPPEPDELAAVGPALDTFRLVRGAQPPRVWIIDDPAPNALAYGHAQNGNAAFTTGALQLPRPELDALCAYLATALTTPGYVFAVSAVDLLLLCAIATNVLWAGGILVLFSAGLGVPGLLVAISVFGIVTLVAVTRVFIVLARRTMPRLLDDVSALSDLETVRCTDQPHALAALLVHLLEDRRRVVSRWQIEHLWFERDVDESRPKSWSLGAQLIDFLPFTNGFSGLELPMGANTRRSLAERAATAIELADGAPDLTERLRRVTAAS